MLLCVCFSTTKMCIYFDAISINFVRIFFNSSSCTFLNFVWKGQIYEMTLLLRSHWLRLQMRAIQKSNNLELEEDRLYFILFFYCNHNAWEEKNGSENRFIRLGISLVWCLINYSLRTENLPSSERVQNKISLSNMQIPRRHFKNKNECVNTNQLKFW